MRRRVLFWAIVGPLMLFGSFFGTLRILDWRDQNSDFDELHTAHAKQIKAAMEAYRSKNGRYPAPFPDNPLSDVQKATGQPLLQDPAGGANEYRYVSSKDGTRYGVLFHLPSGATCIFGVGFAGEGWWQNAPACK